MLVATQKTGEPLLWLKERGIDFGSSRNNQARNLESDPIFGAVNALRKQLNDEAKLLIEETSKRADEKVAEVNIKYTNLQTKLTDLQEKYNDIAVVHNELKDKKLEDNLLQEIRDKTHAEASLKSRQEEFFRDKTQFENDIEEQKDKYNALTKSSAKDTESLHVKYKEEISLIKEYSEKQRHDHMVEIENLKVSRSKLEKELGKAKELEKKVTRINIETTQQLKRLEKEAEHIQKGNSTLVSELRSSESVLAERKGEIKQLQILLNSQKEDYQDSNKQLLDYKERVGRLEEQLQQAKQAIEEKSKLNKKKTNKK